jgi:hypothetical protein
MGHLEQGLYWLKAFQGLGPARADSTPPADTQAALPEVLELVRAIQQDGAQYSARLEALFRMVVTMDRAMAFVGAVFQNSKVVDFIMQRNVPWRKGSLAEDPEEVGSCFTSLARREAYEPWWGYWDVVPFLDLLLMVKRRVGDLEVISGFPDTPLTTAHREGRGNILTRTMALAT